MIDATSSPLSVGTTAPAQRVGTRTKAKRLGVLSENVFATIEALKTDLVTRGRDVIDLGFGNPDLPASPLAVTRLSEAAAQPSSHRYSPARGLLETRTALASYYTEEFGVELDADREVLVTVGSTEALAHLLWALADPDDPIILPTPYYPPHWAGVALAGAKMITVPAVSAISSIAEIVPTVRPRVVLVSFPHNPTTTVATREDLQVLVDLAREYEFTVVHDFAYAGIGFDGHEPASIFTASGAKTCAVELFSLTKTFSMPGWRIGFAIGSAENIENFARLKSYIDYGVFQPIQLAAATVLNNHREYAAQIQQIYLSRRDALCTALAAAGWHVESPRGTMFVWAPLPPPLRDLGSVGFATQLAHTANVVVSPGRGFGETGDGFVRMALIEGYERLHEAGQRIGQLLP